jgi:hypothetical protein
MERKGEKSKNYINKRLKLKGRMEKGEEETEKRSEGKERQTKSEEIGQRERN